MESLLRAENALLICSLQGNNNALEYCTSCCNRNSKGPSRKSFASFFQSNKALPVCVTKGFISTT